MAYGAGVKLDPWRGRLGRRIGGCGGLCQGARTCGFAFDGGQWAVCALWIGRLRFVGGLGCLLGLLIWSQTVRPLLMISDTGALMGILAPQGRLLNKSKGAGFVAQNWLQNDGDGRQQSQAALGWKLTFGDMEWVHIPGKKTARAATEIKL